MWKSECQWRKEFDTSLVIQNDDPEVKLDPVVKSRVTSLVASVVLSSSALADRFQKFSSWHRLKKSIAWILRYRNNLLMTAKDRKVTDQPKSPGRKQSLITIEEMKNAEKAILKTVQPAAYPMEFSELGKLRSGKGVKRSSPLFRLDPILKDGLLCVGGRLARACIPPEAKHQIILPKSSHISDRNYWPLGRIQQVFPDKKGFVRKVRVKVKSAVLERPVDKLVLLVEKEESKHAEP